MKYLVLLLVLAVALAWVSLGRRRRPPEVPPPKPAPGPAKEPATATKATPAARMLACTHCQVHLPESDALFDASGRPFCSEAHRLAGPR